MRQLDELSQIESLLLGHRQPVEGEDRFCHEVAPDMFNTQDIMHGNRATLDVYSKHYCSDGIIPGSPTYLPKDIAHTHI